MDLNEVIDSLSREFLLARMKREIDAVHDPEQLRAMILQLIALVEDQKSMFKKLMWELIEENPEAQKMFE